MPIKKFEDRDLDVTIFFDFATDILFSFLPFSLWAIVGRVALKTVGKVIDKSVNAVTIGIRQKRDEIFIEIEKSRAYMRTEAILEVAKIYARGKREIEAGTRGPFSQEEREMLLRELHYCMEDHVHGIIIKYRDWG